MHTASVRRDLKILEQCHEVGLSLLWAVQLATADGNDRNGLLRLLNLDFETLEPIQNSQDRQWGLRAAANTSSVSYRGTLTADDLANILLTAEVPSAFMAHIGHFLDEAPLPWVVKAVVEAADRGGVSIQTVWCNVTKIAIRHSDTRKQLWRFDPARET